MCLSVHEGGLPSMHHMTRGWSASRGEGGVGQTYRGVCIGAGRLGRGPPQDRWDTMGYGQQAGAIHILLECFLVRNKNTHYISALYQCKAIKYLCRTPIVFNWVSNLVECAVSRDRTTLPRDQKKPQNPNCPSPRKLLLFML